MGPCRCSEAQGAENGTRAFFKTERKILPNAGWGPVVALRAAGESGKIMRYCDMMKKHEKFFLIKRDRTFLWKEHDSSVEGGGRETSVA